MRPLALLLAATAASFLAGAACAATDRSFVKDALEGDNAEVQLGQIAKQRGASPQARDFGQMLVTDHGQHKGNVAPLAQAHGVTDMNAVPPEAKKEADTLQGLSGKAFDREFAHYMVRDHQKDLAAYQQAAASAHDPAIRSLARDTLPTLHKHLEAAERLEHM